MSLKKNQRLRRGLKTRSLIRKHKVIRLSVHKTAQHIYAQVFSADNNRVIVSASSLEKSFRKAQSTGGNVEAAVIIGKLVAERALEAGVESVAFDRGGYKYHGRIKALADAAREAGMHF
jgi:large subunit ribosomal protein L18